MSKDAVAAFFESLAVDEEMQFDLAWFAQEYGFECSAEELREAGLRFARCRDSTAAAQQPGSSATSGRLPQGLVPES